MKCHMNDNSVSLNKHFIIVSSHVRDHCLSAIWRHWVTLTGKEGATTMITSTVAHQVMICFSITVLRHKAH